MTLLGLFILDLEILDKCVRSGDFDKVKEIVENHKDCDLEWPSNSGTTLLMRAAVMGHHAISELLIMNGADLNAKHSSGVTALISAATNVRRVDTVIYRIISFHLIYHFNNIH